MKKIIITLALAAAAALSANAQIAVGVGYQTKNYSNDGPKNGGIYAGVTYNYTLSDGLAVAAGIDLSYLTSNDDGVKVKEMNIGVPVLLNYAIPVADGFVLTPFAGPTFSYGLSFDVENSGISLNMYDNSIAQMKRFDVLVGGGVALDVQNLIRVSVGYNKGLLNRADSDDDDDKTTTGGLHFGVAYLF